MDTRNKDHPSLSFIIIDWFIFSFKVYEAKPLDDWILVFPMKEQADAQKMFNCMQMVARKIGMAINEPIMYDDVLLK